jgi:hypothetical protein
MLPRFLPGQNIDAPSGTTWIHKSRFYGFADRRLRAAAWRWLFVVGHAEI